jgi:DNA-binding response OmpR family regulator
MPVQSRHDGRPGTGSIHRGGLNSQRERVGTMRLLVVEDDRKIADLIVRSLRAERFAVGVAFDGMTGWEMAANTDYDLIILDRMLPGMTGDELLRRLREDRRGVAVLIVTARDSIEEKINIFEAGADDYLTKPFSLAELVVRVKALLRRPSGDGGYVLRVADLEVDRIGQRAKRAGKRIQLTSKEYALLEYLVAHAGRVLSRTMIVEHVWDDNFDGLTNIVDVYVRHLRSKVDDPFPVKLIHTVRRAGYVLQEMTTAAEGGALAGRNPELGSFSAVISPRARYSQNPVGGV